MRFFENAAHRKIVAWGAILVMWLLLSLQIHQLSNDLEQTKHEAGLLTCTLKTSVKGGTEEERRARFLEDCGHLLEGTP